MRGIETEIKFRWMGLVWTISTCSGVTIQLARRNVSDDRSLSPAIFLPLIAVMTQATTGGLIVNYSAGISSAEAIPIIIVSYMLIGYALCLAVLYYAMYLHRLLAVGPPQQPKIPSLVILVGPCGQFATAVQLLGTAAYTRGHFAAYNQGTFLTASAASSVSTVSTILALLVDGFAFLWITITWYLFVEALVKRRVSFGLTWWSLIFPMGTFAPFLCFHVTITGKSLYVVWMIDIGRCLHDVSNKPLHRYGFPCISRTCLCSPNLSTHNLLLQFGFFCV